MAQEDRFTGLVGYSGVKVPVRMATTAAITLSGLQTIDGIVGAADDRVLVKDQASAINNGIYIMDTGAWNRAPDADGPYDFVQGSLVPVYAGTSYAGSLFAQTVADPEPGETSLNFSAYLTLFAFPTTVANGGTGATTAAAARTNLGVPSTTEAVLNSLLTAKGSMLAASAASTAAELAVGADGYLLRPSSGASKGVVWAAPGFSATLINGKLVHSRAASAETIALKTEAGTDPTDADPVFVIFRNVTATEGGLSILKVVAATSIAISSGSTLGTVNAVPFRLWVVGFNDGGTFRLGVINCATVAANAGSGYNVTDIYPLSGFGIASSTAEGGGGAADSAGVFYTGAAVVSKAYLPLGYSTWEAGLAAVGTWDTAPSRTQPFGTDVPLPGRAIQLALSIDGAAATGTTTMPKDDTIPQNTEGDQYLSKAITPSSAANALAAFASVNTGSSASGQMTSALFVDSVANAIQVAGREISATGTIMHTQPLSLLYQAGLNTARTFKVRAGNNNAGTTTFNGFSSARQFGGVAYSKLEIQELMT